MNIAWNWPGHNVKSANKQLRWARNSGSTKKERARAALETANALKPHIGRHSSPYHVTLFRIGKKKLDEHDNLQPAFKAIVDGICEALGMKDHDPKLTFDYYQATAKEYSVSVMIKGWGVHA
jgi:hypothetical protein